MLPQPTAYEHISSRTETLHIYTPYHTPPRCEYQSHMLMRYNYPILDSGGLAVRRRGFSDHPRWSPFSCAHGQTILVLVLSRFAVACLLETLDFGNRSYRVGSERQASNRPSRRHLISRVSWGAQVRVGSGRVRNRVPSGKRRLLGPRVRAGKLCSQETCFMFRRRLPRFYVHGRVTTGYQKKKAFVHSLDYTLSHQRFRT